MCDKCIGHKVHNAKPQLVRILDLIEKYALENTQTLTHYCIWHCFKPQTLDNDIILKKCAFSVFYDSSYSAIWDNFQDIALILYGCRKFAKNLKTLSLHSCNKFVTLLFKS